MGSLKVESGEPFAGKAFQRTGTECAKAQRQEAVDQDGGNVGGPGGRWGWIMQGLERRAWAPRHCSPANPLQMSTFRHHRCVPLPL